MRYLYKNILALLVIMLMTGCASETIEVRSEERKEIIVFAAASLTEVFGEIKTAYEADNKEVEIIYNFAGSQTLANQILEGGRPDMFFSANEKYADLLIEEGMNPWDLEGYVPEKLLFATNRLVLIYSDTYTFESLDQAVTAFAVEDRKPVVLALEEVPVGKYTKKMMDTYLDQTGDQAGYDGFYSQVASYESDVKAVVAKVRIHEGDLGIVYRTDAAAVDLEANDLSYLDVADTYNQQAVYAALVFSEDSEAKAFYNYVTAGDGQQILRDSGF